MADFIITVRPNGTASNNWNTTGGTADAVLSDDSDASFIFSFGGVAVVDMGTFVLPSGAQIVYMRPRMRAKGPVGGQDQIQVRLSGVDSAGDVFTGTGNTNIINFTGSTYTTRPTDGLPWTQSDLDAVQLRIMDLSQVGTTSVLEAYLDVAYHWEGSGTISGAGDLAATGVTQTEATAFLSSSGNLAATAIVNNPVTAARPHRCKCNKQKCECFILDDGYDGAQISNNNTTTVRGTGLENSPYYVQNIHHPRFVPPAAKVRTFTASTAGTIQFIKFGIIDLNTDAMFNINQPDRFTITHYGIYMFGASIQWNGPPDLYTNFGVYYSNVGGFIGADPAAASPSILHNVQYRANKTNPGETISRISSSYFSSFAFNVGDILRVGVFGGSPSPNPGATLCSFWICYS